MTGKTGRGESEQGAKHHNVSSSSRKPLPQKGGNLRYDSTSLPSSHLRKVGEKMCRGKEERNAPKVQSKGGDFLVHLDAGKTHCPVTSSSQPLFPHFPRLYGSAGFSRPGMKEMKKEVNGNNLFMSRMTLLYIKDFPYPAPHEKTKGR